MIGTRQGAFRFRCPLCHARPGKPCVRLTDPSKTTKAHDQRKRAYYRASGRDEVVAVWSSHYEGNRGKH